MAQFDLVIRNGTIVDGSGGALQDADIAVADGKIAAIGKGLAGGREEIDAKGEFVTPGFVDVHTHYDGQATWADRFQPSTQHGATTIVMGNCGVGFAPCRPEDHDALISLMEGVEDIPAPVLAEGLPWNWETFPDFLDAVEKRHRDADFAAFVPHGPVRVYAMGQRAVRREEATEDDIALMRKIVEDSVRAGAVGFSTSRTLAHRTAAGELTATYNAAHRELIGVAAGLSVSPGAAFQMITDWTDLDPEFDALNTIVRNAKGKGTFTLVQNDLRGDQWRDVLRRVEEANSDGVDITAQAIVRPIGVLLGLDASMHSFSYKPTYKAMKDLPLAARVAQMRDPMVKAQILSEEDEQPHIFMKAFGKRLHRLFELGDKPNYIPDPSESVAARAAREGRDPHDFLYDLMLKDEGQALIYMPITNYSDPSGATIWEMIDHPNTVPALGDGGAHVAMICDASVSSYFLTEWVRRRKAMPLTEAVHRLTRKPAEMFRMYDRGLLKPGMKADINVINLDALDIAPPRIHRDLPAGGKRLLQAAHGFRANIVSGAVTYRDGTATGALPGRLVRGPQKAAA